VGVIGQVLLFCWWPAGQQRFCDLQFGGSKLHVDISATTRVAVPTRGEPGKSLEGNPQAAKAAAKVDQGIL